MLSLEMCKALKEVGMETASVDTTVKDMLKWMVANDMDVPPFKSDENTSVAEIDRLTSLLAERDATIASQSDAVELERRIGAMTKHEDLGLLETGLWGVWDSRSKTFLGRDSTSLAALRAAHIGD